MGHPPFTTTETTPRVSAEPPEFDASPRAVRVTSARNGTTSRGKCSWTKPCSVSATDPRSAVLVRHGDENDGPTWVAISPRQVASLEEGRGFESRPRYTEVPRPSPGAVAFFIGSWRCGSCREARPRHPLPSHEKTSYCTKPGNTWRCETRTLESPSATPAASCVGLGVDGFIVNHRGGAYRFCDGAKICGRHSSPECTTCSSRPEDLTVEGADSGDASSGAGSGPSVGYNGERTEEP
jgi:hypothetical protein